MQETPIIIVDTQDQVVGVKDKSAITSQDIYRVVSLWIENSDGQVLLAQRSFSKKHHPGKWGPAVEGTLEEGSSYASKIIQRSREEVGLDIKESDIVPGKKIYIITPYHHFNQTFTLSQKLNREISDFHIDTNEVHELKWWNKTELKKEISQSPDRFVTLLEDFLD